MEFPTPKLAKYDAISIAEAAARIVDAAIARLTVTNKLILALGENHLTTSHRLPAAQVLEGLHAQGVPVTFAIEEQENVIPAFLRDVANIDIGDVPEMIWSLVNKIDSNGHTRAKTILANDDDLATAPLEIALKYSLPVIYADAARKKTDAFIAVDLKDAKTATIAQDLYGDSWDGVDLPSASIAGVHIRNHFMLQACTESVGFLTPGPHIVMLQAGRAHIQGSATDYTYDAKIARQENRPHPALPYNQSLAGIAAANNLPFLGACLTSPAGMMNGVESEWHEGTFYFDLPGNLDIETHSDPGIMRAKKLAYMQESLEVIARFVGIGRSLSRSLSRDLGL